MIHHLFINYMLTSMMSFYQFSMSLFAKLSIQCHHVHYNYLRNKVKTYMVVIIIRHNRSVSLSANLLRGLRLPRKRLEEKAHTLCM